MDISTMIASAVREIAKEQIPQLHFVEREVLFNDDDKKSRKNELYKAMLLGNLNKAKSKITFATQNGLRKVETTVWAVDEKEVLLKYGFFIPIHSIIRVDLL
jgi:hypothetical protein